jgi:hypothetical protein
VTRLYAYCLCDGAAAARLNLGGAVGVGGVGARAAEVAGFVAVVSDFAGERVRISRAGLLAHNHVNGLVLALTTPLPFRFGTLVTPAQLDEYAARNETILRARLARVRGCVEMGVKIIRPPASGDESPAPEAAGLSAPGAAVSTPSASSPSAGRGTAYLTAKRRAILGDERRRAEAGEIAARLNGFVSGVVREASERLSPAETLVLRAAHLVERERVADYQSRLREFGASCPDLRLLASGPWPPYSFAA